MFPFYNPNTLYAYHHDQCNGENPRVLQYAHVAYAVHLEFNASGMLVLGGLCSKMTLLVKDEQFMEAIDKFGQKELFFLNEGLHKSLHGAFLSRRNFGDLKK